MDELIEKVGSFGKFQCICLILIGSITALCGINQYMSVFNAAVPKLLCKYKSQDAKDANFSYLENSCEAFNNISESNQANIESPYDCQFDSIFFIQTFDSVTHYKNFVL